MSLRIAQTSRLRIVERSKTLKRAKPDDILRLQIVGGRKGGIVVMDRCLLVRAIAIGGLVAAVGGCSFNRQQINQADLPKLVEGVVPGQTTVAQLEEMAGGPPTSITPIDDKQIYVYTFGDAKTKGLTLIILNISKTNAAIDTGLFLINKDNIVEAMQVGKNSEDLSWEWWAFGD